MRWGHDFTMTLVGPSLQRTSHYLTISASKSCVLPQWVSFYQQMAPQFPALIKFYTVRTVLIIFSVSNSSGIFHGVLVLFPSTLIPYISACLSHLDLRQTSIFSTWVLLRASSLFLHQLHSAASSSLF